MIFAVRQKTSGSNGTMPHGHVSAYTRGHRTEGNARTETTERLIPVIPPAKSLLGANRF